VLGFSVLLFFDTLTQISMKLAGNHALPMDFDWPWFLRVLKTYWVYIALAGYFGSFATWMTLLKHAPVGTSFAASHLEIVTVTLCSAYLFGESLTGMKLLGGGLILLGVGFLAIERDLKERSRRK
jgi:drug/metabolite transporter (DMT)-like permease